jgi:hypothetical protein
MAVRYCARVCGRKLQVAGASQTATFRRPKVPPASITDTLRTLISRDFADAFDKVFTGSWRPLVSAARGSLDLCSCTSSRAGASGSATGRPPLSDSGQGSCYPSARLRAIALRTAARPCCRTFGSRYRTNR